MAACHDVRQCALELQRIAVLGMFVGWIRQEKAQMNWPGRLNGCRCVLNAAKAVRGQLFVADMYYIIGYKEVVPRFYGTGLLISLLSTSSPLLTPPLPRRPKDNAWSAFFISSPSSSCSPPTVLATLAGFSLPAIKYPYPAIQRLSLARVSQETNRLFVSPPHALFPIPMAMSLSLSPVSDASQQGGIDSNSNNSNLSVSNNSNSSSNNIATTINDQAQIPPASGVKRKPSRRANTAERRATHNAVERQRRETLNGRFLVSRSYSLPRRFIVMFSGPRTLPSFSPIFRRSAVRPNPPSSILPSLTFKLLVATALLHHVNLKCLSLKPMPSVAKSTNGETAPASRA